MNVFSEKEKVWRDNALAGGGEMGRLMREYDWDTSALGPVSQWPQSLRTAVSICLASRFPIIIFWGEELQQFYNDAYRPILGTSKHPQALAQRAQECWPEIWDVVGPMLTGVLSSGEATWSENQLLFMDRNGYVEETYFTFSYSPMRGESGEIGGVFCAVTETTGEVIGERRLRTLSTLTSQTAEAKSPVEVCERAAQTLASNEADLPFALFYLLDPAENTAQLVGATGMVRTSIANLTSIALTDPNAVWPLEQVVTSGNAVHVDDLASRFDALPKLRTTEEGTDPREALVLPISRAGEGRPYGFLVVGINPHHRLDDAYHNFLMLVAGQVATAVTNAHTYQEARKRAEALAELDRAKTAFFSNVSHELRTPLTLLLGPVEALLSEQTGSLSQEQREQLEMVQRNGLRLLKLVNALLDFSRIEAGRARVMYQPTDLASMTADLASAFRSLIEQAGMRLIVDCPPLPEPIYVDREMWEKIVLNLLSNAFKFTLEGQISVTLRSMEDGVELVVTDTGSGIAPEDQVHLFERFYRVENVRARSAEGSGIGLSLVQELVRLHGGRITVWSQPGEGTSFTVRIPRGSAHLQVERVAATRVLSSSAPVAVPYVEEASRWLAGAHVVGPDGVTVDEHDVSLHASTGVSGRKEDDATVARVLIVDDNADMRDYLSHLLGSAYELQLATDGKSALEIVRALRPDLIISDVMMPGMDGFTLLKELRSTPDTAMIPVILLSARASEEATVEGLTRGADDYLVKPFAARELRARVQARLEIARLQRQTAVLEQRTHSALQTLLEIVETMVQSTPTRADLDGAAHATRHRTAQQFVEITCKLLGCSTASIIALEHVTDPLQPIAIAGFSQEMEEQFYAQMAQTTLQDYIPAAEIEKLQRGEPVLFDLAGASSAGLSTYGVHVVLGTPMRLGEQLVGFLSMDYSSAEHRYPLQEEMALIAAIGKLAAVVLERERLIRERTEAQAAELAARDANRLKDEFIGIAGHELRTPLTTIRMSVQLAKRQLGRVLQQGQILPTEIVKNIETLGGLLDRTERQVSLQNRLVNDLLDVSRIEVGRLELHPELHDLTGLVREVVEDQRFLTPQRTIFFSFDAEDELLIMVDADRVRQVINNYLSNAIKYSDVERAVKVRVLRVGSQARLEVMDEGPGLSLTQQQHIWERFYRAPGIEVKSGTGVGLGLGLYICRTLIERQGGRVGVQSRLGEGSTFWFTLPLAGV